MNYDVDDFNSYPGVLKSLLVGVDPKHYRAIALGLKYLDEDFGPADDDTIDKWFSAIYGTVLALEEVHEREIDSWRGRLPSGVTKLNYEDLVVRENHEPLRIERLDDERSE